MRLLLIDGVCGFGYCMGESAIGGLRMLANGAKYGF